MRKVRLVREQMFIKMGKSEDELAELVCIRSKEGHNFAVIGIMYEIPSVKVFGLIANKLGLRPREVRSAFKMKENGESIESIGLELNLPLAKLYKFLPNTPQSNFSMPSKRSKLIENDDSPNPFNSTLEKRKLQAFIPKYTFHFNNKVLQVTELKSRRVSQVFLPYYYYRPVDWCQSPEGKLYCLEVKKQSIKAVDIFRDYSLTDLAHIEIQFVRNRLAYNRNFIYIIGNNTSKCLRFELTEKRWEDLDCLPFPCCDYGFIMLEATQCLYVFGGHSAILQKPLDYIQRLSLESLTWDFLQIKLPFAFCGYICVFNVYKVVIHFIIDKKLFMLKLTKFEKYYGIRDFCNKFDLTQKFNWELLTASVRKVR